MEKISSRRNIYIAHLRKLAADPAYRRETGETVCAGEKLLREAQNSGMTISSALYCDEPAAPLSGARTYLAPRELMDYASPVKNGPGPVFTVKVPHRERPEKFESAIVLENIQDPGNLGTIIRAADALGAGAVITLGDCADLWSPRVVRATMGAAFRADVIASELEELPALMAENGLTLYGAVLRDGARDVRDVKLINAAVAVGNEGSGLTEELINLCSECLIIPMSPHSESLNAAMAATLLIWEMVREK